MSEISQTIHMCIDVRGVLRNFKAREWRRCCTDPKTGQVMTPDEVKDYFLDCLAKGYRVVPMGEKCEGFSYETGCPGHPAPPQPEHPHWAPSLGAPHPSDPHLARLSILHTHP